MDTTIRIFRTTYRAGKYESPFTDMPVEVDLQQLNGLNMERVLQSIISYADIIDHISCEMQKMCVKI